MTHADLETTVRDVLILDFNETRYVVLAGDVADVSIADGEGDEATTDAPWPAANTHDVAAILGHASPADSRTMGRRYLRVRVGHRDVVFTCDASLTVACVERDAFYRLPRLLRRSGAAAWVRGVVVFAAQQAEDEWTHHNSDGSVLADEELSASLALWIDLRLLAERVSGQRFD